MRYIRTHLISPGKVSNWLSKYIQHECEIQLLAIQLYITPVSFMCYVWSVCSIGARVSESSSITLRDVDYNFAKSSSHNTPLESTSRVYTREVLWCIPPHTLPLILWPVCIFGNLLYQSIMLWWIWTSVVLYSCHSTRQRQDAYTQCAGGSSSLRVHKSNLQWLYICGGGKLVLCPIPSIFHHTSNTVLSELHHYNTGHMLNMWRSDWPCSERRPRELLDFLAHNIAVGW